MANWLDYYRCERIIKRSSKTFYAAFSKIPDKHTRNAVYAVYAFCRTADDAVDRYHDAKRLNDIHDGITHYLLNNESSSNFMWRALQDTLQRYPSSITPYIQMISGQRMDLDNQPYHTMDDLVVYCEAVASSVGWMLNPILTPTKANELHECARSLGIAMQITNILRDIGEDFRINRCYIPDELFVKYKYSKTQLSHGIITPEFVELFEYLATFAYKHYRIAETSFSMYPKEIGNVLLVASRFYEEIINACRAANYDVFTKRNFVTTQRKIEILADLKTVEGR